MKTILSSVVVGEKNGKSIKRMELAVSSVDELAEVDDAAHGSIAWVIPTGEFYGFADGEWYKQ